MNKSSQIKEHFYWLDALRFIAAFMVLLSHSRNTFFPEYGALPSEQHNFITMAFTMFCRMGHEAVIIFFVLSGFLVGGRGFERIKAGTMNVKSYAIDRFSRIYPPLFAAIIFCGISVYVTGKTYCTNFTWQNALGNILNLQGICCKSVVSPFWSLSYEVWFYIILGAIAVLLMTNKNHTKISSLLVFVAAVSVFVLGLKMHYLLIWMMGAVAYIARPKQKSRWVLILSIIGFFTGVIYYQLSKDTHAISFAIKGANVEFTELFMSVMACLMIQQMILFEPQSKIAKAVEGTIGNMAKFSYTLYLSHRIVFLWIIAYLWRDSTCDFSLRGISMYLATILISLFVCWLIYLVSERYSPEIKKYLKAKLLE